MSFKRLLNFVKVVFKKGDSEFTCEGVLKDPRTIVRELDSYPKGEFEFRFENINYL